MYVLTNKMIMKVMTSKKNIFYLQGRLLFDHFILSFVIYKQMTVKTMFYICIVEIKGDMYSL